MVSICEVGPRDGLQNMKPWLEPEQRVEMIVRLAEAGLKHIEAVSFVHPKRVPQMAGAEEILSALPPLPGVTLAALVLNMKGADRALTTRADEIRAVVVASDTFSERNQNSSIEQDVAFFESLAARTDLGDRALTGVIAASFGCPFEGEVPESRVADIASRMVKAGAGMVVFADTIGVAAPRDVHRVLKAVKAKIGDHPIGLHLHNTRNTGYAAAIAGLEEGISLLDSSIGGLGGCPFAPAATGNIATEDLHYLLNREGLKLSLDQDKLCETVDWLQEKLGDKIDGQLSRAGWFGDAAAQ